MSDEQYLGPVTAPVQLHPHSEASTGFIDPLPPLSTPPTMFLRSAFFNLVAFFKKFCIVIWFLDYYYVSDCSKLNKY